MKAEDINPIIKAVYTVGNSFLGKEPVMGDIFVTKDMQESNGVLIGITISGDFDGEFILYFNINSLKIIAGSMIGMEVEEIDEIVLSAVSEFSNMVMGNAATNYSLENKRVNISAPEVNKNMGKINYSRILALPFWINDKNKFQLYFIQTS